MRPTNRFGTSRPVHVKIPAGMFRSDSAANDVERWTDRVLYLVDDLLMITYYGRRFEVRIPTRWAARRWPPHWVAVPDGTPASAIVYE